MRGRDTEQGLVRHMLELARRGKGSVLLVEGEPGAGKTSLLTAAGTLVDVLEHTGATRIHLAPLTGEAQAALMRDLLGGIPDEDLADSAACAAGNPLMLTEFLRGLVDEGAVSIAAGRARLLSPR